MLIRKIVKGDTAVLLCMMRDLDGTPLTPADVGPPSGSITVVVRRDFKPFDVISGTAVTPTVLATPKGTVSNPDPRWVPGVDGAAGYNVEVVIPASYFSTQGTYFATVRAQKTATDVVQQVFRIHVGSSQ